MKRKKKLSEKNVPENKYFRNQNFPKRNIKIKKIN